ncbi:MAG: hypothetical protein II610_02730 [Treponema sp.]|nr:hypothetical protein [Treponema sp.]
MTRRERILLKAENFLAGLKLKPKFFLFFIDRIKNGWRCVCDGEQIASAPTVEEVKAQCKKWAAERGDSDCESGFMIDDLTPA